MKIRESIPDFHFLNADFILLPSNYYLPKFFGGLKMFHKSKFKDFQRPQWMKESFKDSQGLKFKGVQDACEPWSLNLPNSNQD